MNPVLIQTLHLSIDLLAATIPLMVAGVFLAELVTAFHAADRISRITRPITTFAHLHPECGTSFLLAFISPKAANTMLVTLQKNDAIDRREMIIAALINSFPNVVMHWRYLLPVYVPLLGVWGLLYFLILMGVGFGKTAFVMVAGRRLLPPDGTLPTLSDHVERTGWRSAVRIAASSSVPTLRRILGVSVPTLVVVAFLISLGVFDGLADAMQPLAGWFPVPAAGFAIIAAQFGSFIAGATVASALLGAKTLTGWQIITVLLVGNILTSVTRGIRWYGSSYAAIFGPRTGAEILTISTCLRNGLMVLVVVVLAVLGGS